MALDLRGIEDVQRTTSVERHVVGDVDERVDRAQADRQQPPLHPFRRRAILDAAHEAQGEDGAQLLVAGLEIERYRDGAWAARSRLRGTSWFFSVPRPAAARSRAIPMDRRAIGPVRREVDLDHRVVEARIGRVGLPHGRIVGQVDDAVVIVGDFEFGRRAQHAPAFDAADVADPERDVLARNVGAGRREDALHAGARIGCAADDLDGRAFAHIDHADPQAIGIRMLLGRYDIGNRVRRERLGLVLDALDLEADARQRLDDLVEGRRGVEMVLQPGECEFHRFSPVRT